MFLEIFLMSAIATAVGMIAGYWIHKTSNSFAYQKMYYYTDSRWLDVNKYPIPDDIKDFICCDGKKVRFESRLAYNKFGKPIMGWEDKEILFWMPMPKYEITEKPKNEIDNLNFRTHAE